MYLFATKIETEMIYVPKNSTLCKTKKLDTMYHICAHCDFIFIIIFSEDSGFFCVQPPNLSRSQITHLFIVYKPPNFRMM